MDFEIPKEELNTEQSDVELRWILAVVRRRWWLILGCALLAAVVALAVTSLQPPDYEATVTFLIQPAQDVSANEYNLLMAGERLALTYTQMLVGQPVLEAVISQMGLQESPDELVDRIEAETIRDTQLIRLTVTDSSPHQAALIANTLAGAFMELIQALNAERYAALQTSVQEKLDALSLKMEETQAEMAATGQQQVEVDVELARLERQLGSYREDYQALQRDYQALQSSVEQLKSDVSVVEPAQLPAEPSFPPYTATVTLLLADDAMAGTYGEVLAGRPVLEAAIAQVGLEVSPDELVDRVKVEPVEDTRLVRLAVSDSQPAQAVSLANAIAQAFINQVQALKSAPYASSLASMQAQMEALSESIAGTEAQLAGPSSERIRLEMEASLLVDSLADQRSDYRALQQDYEQLGLTGADASDTVVVVGPAKVPQQPVQQRWLYTLLAAIAGALLAFGIAFLLEYLDDTFRTPGDVRRLLGMNALGAIGRLPKREAELVVHARPRSPLAEAFRSLATNLRSAGLDRPLRTLLVTSPDQLEGKSLLAANLAAALAHKELRVVLVDADLRLPRQHEVFGVEPGKGLSAALQQGHLDGHLQPSPVGRLDLLAAGETPSNPADAVDSQPMRQILAGLAQEVDLVVIDSPPLLPVSDAAALAAAVDGVLLVLRAGQTHAQAARQAVERLRQVRANLVGIVLNDVHEHASDYYDYYHRYESQGNGAARRTRWGRMVVPVTRWIKKSQ